MADSEPTTEDMGTSEKIEGVSPDIFEPVPQTPEREIKNEDEYRIDGEKNIEDKYLKEEKQADPLLKFILESESLNAKDWQILPTIEGCRFDMDKNELFDQNGKSVTELMKNYELNSPTSIEVQSHFDMLDHFRNNPNEPYKLMDNVEKTENGEKIYKTACTVDNEGNVTFKPIMYEEKKEKEGEKEEKPIDKPEEKKAEEETLNLELNIDIDKQEEISKETLLDQSLLAEIEVIINEQEIEKIEEIVQNEEDNLVISEINFVDKEPITIKEEEDIQSSVISYEEFANRDSARNGEQLVEKNVTEEKINVDKENTINVNKEKEIINIYISKNVEEKNIDNVQKIPTLEDRIKELLRDENEQTEEVFGQIQMSQAENTQQEQILDINRITEINPTTENVAETEIISPSTYTEVNELAVNETPNPITERSVISNEQIEQVIINSEDVENQIEIHETIQTVYTENIQEQNTEQVEQIFATNKVEAHKAEEKPEEIVLTNDKDIKVVNTREQINNTKENQVVAKEATPEKIQTPNIRTEKEVKDNIIPFKTTEIKADLKNIEVKNTKPVVTEKINTSKEINRLPNINREKIVTKNQQEKASKNSREVIVLNINGNKINNTTRNEKPAPLEILKTERKILTESEKNKLLDGHEILLQILGISSNVTRLSTIESINTKSSVPNSNQEELENKSTKLIPSRYQSSNLNGITLKIAV